MMHEHGCIFPDCLVETELGGRACEHACPYERKKMRKAYGYTESGALIAPPVDGPYRKPQREWEIVPEGEDVPQVHREFIDYLGVRAWCGERTCHSTMTPDVAQVWGSVRAFARLRVSA